MSLPSDAAVLTISTGSVLIVLLLATSDSVLKLLTETDQDRKLDFHLYNTMFGGDKM